MAGELSMFEGVTAVWYCRGNDSEIDAGAAKALRSSGDPQAVHRHGPDEACVRGGGCYVLRPKEENGG